MISCFGNKERDQLLFHSWTCDCLQEVPTGAGQLEHVVPEAGDTFLGRNCLSIPVVDELEGFCEDLHVAPWRGPGNHCPCFVCCAVGGALREQGRVKGFGGNREVFPWGRRGLSATGILEESRGRQVQGAVASWTVEVLAFTVTWMIGQPLKAAGVVFGSAEITLVTGLVRELTIAYTTGLIVLVHSKTQNGQKGHIGLACRSSAVLVYQRVGAPMESVIYQGETHLRAGEPVRVPRCGSRCCARLQSKGEHILNAGSHLGHRKAGVPLQRSLASK